MGDVIKYMFILFNTCLVLVIPIFNMSMFKLNSFNTDKIEFRFLYMFIENDDGFEKKF